MSDDFIAHLQDLFAPMGELSARRMFGGQGVYLDGLMIGVVMDDGLYLKADAQSAAQFEAAGSAPFVYDSGGKRVTMSYWSAPETAMDSPQAMQPWARRAVEAALRKGQAKGKPAGLKPRSAATRPRSG